MSARKARRAPKPVPVIDLWRRHVPLEMWLVGVDPLNAPAKEREDARLLTAIEDSGECDPEATAVKLHVAFEFGDQGEFVRDLPWCVLASMVRALLPQIPSDLKAALRPFIVPERSKRTVGEAWHMGAASAFPKTVQEVERARGEAA